ncbi:MAG: hypothetical protein ACKVTZ_13050 [Bacteroidia bacterium]
MQFIYICMVLFVFFLAQSMGNLVALSSCDVIVLKDGQNIEAKIIKVETTNVTYQLCGEKSHVQHLSLAQVAEIQFSDVHS